MCFSKKAANYSPDIIPPSPPVPKPRKKSPLKAFNVFPKLTENSTNPVKNFKSPRSLQGTPNYLKHTTVRYNIFEPYIGIGPRNFVIDLELCIKKSW